MQFKIDTKETYAVITPLLNHIDANMTAAIGNKCSELAQQGINNYIIDFQNCITADNTSFGELLLLHEKNYDQSQSLVFTGICENIMNMMKEKELDLSINIAPKMIEAVDIISMEILERDLFNESE
ncbi:MAG: hypothetical protein JST82_06330 [Bacteroidetes bacterium]|nr:hypothetical protein [Bacteroidota bacterium]